ncbi:MAG: heme exporter protein CcmB [Gammaproteobacteria bacterium]|nr:MAG: heme exporter protein CcmB [Gammaproteobacteria bacterium]PIE36280.1 MAG: heme exporter protein CcmB [Gammaproteobacteria bacterium]
MIESRAPLPLGRLFARTLRRDLRIARLGRGAWLNPPLFFLLIVVLFPLGIGPGQEILARIAPGVIWVAAALSMLLSLESLFAADHREGTLEQMVLAGHPLSVVVLAKTLAHWLLSGLPLVLTSPLLASVLFLPAKATPVLMLSLLLGTLTLSLIGTIAAALTVSVNQGGVLLSLLVLPLSAPVLIFGVGAIDAAATLATSAGPLWLLAALLAGALTLAPMTAAAALRIGVAAGR